MPFIFYIMLYKIPTLIFNNKYSKTFFTVLSFIQTFKLGIAYNYYKIENIHNNS